MSVKINKNGNEYPLGVIPQSLYDDVEDLKEAANKGSVSVTADGVKTYSEILDDLYALIDTDKITNISTLQRDSINCVLVDNGATKEFSVAWMNASHYGISFFSLGASGSTFFEMQDGTITDKSNSVVNAGRVFTFRY